MLWSVALAGACQRHGAGGLIVQFTINFFGLASSPPSAIKVSPRQTKGLPLHQTSKRACTPMRAPPRAGHSQTRPSLLSLSSFCFAAVARIEN